MNALADCASSDGFNLGMVLLGGMIGLVVLVGILTLWTRRS